MKKRHYPITFSPDEPSINGIQLLLLVVIFILFVGCGVTFEYIIKSKQVVVETQK